MPTPRELENAIKKRVFEAGVAEKIFPLKTGNFERSGFSKSNCFNKLETDAYTLLVRRWGFNKNYIMFVENPSDYHADSCADLAAIWSLPHVKGKTRLNVLVMLTPLFHSVGPHGFSMDYIWQYKGIIVGTDPVACDAVGLKIIEAKRKEFFGEEKPLNPPAKHIKPADTRHHLGTADMNKIDLIKLGMKEGILI